MKSIFSSFSLSCLQKEREGKGKGGERKGGGVVGRGGGRRGKERGREGVGGERKEGGVVGREGEGRGKERGWGNREGAARVGGKKKGGIIVKGEILSHCAKILKTQFVTYIINFEKTSHHNRPDPKLSNWTKSLSLHTVTL